MTMTHPPDLGESWQALACILTTIGCRSHRSNFNLSGDPRNRDTHVPLGPSAGIFC